MKSEATPLQIRVALRLEGALVAAIGIYLYAQGGASWWLFAVLILAPDLSALGYLKDNRIGAACYNAAHTYLAPALLWVVLWTAGTGLATSLALIWVVHIGADRLLGYGLKYPDRFGRTHLSR